MENASKALIIAGAILLSILIIAIGMFIYNSAQSTINDSMTSFSTQEIEAFNNNFESYKGNQTGSNVNSLITRLIANAKTYKDEATKVPVFYINQITAAGGDGFNNAIPVLGGDNKGQQNYIDSLTKIKNKVENKHTYWISFTYQDNGLIDVVQVTYNAAAQGGELNDPPHREVSSNSITLKGV